MQRTEFFQSLLRLQPGDTVEFKTDSGIGSVTKLADPIGNHDLYYLRYGGIGRRINGWGKVTGFLEARMMQSSEFVVRDGMTEFTVEGCRTEFCRLLEPY